MFNAREKVEPCRGKNIRLKDFMKEYLHCKENANIVTYMHCCLRIRRTL